VLCVRLCVLPGLGDCAVDFGADLFDHLSGGGGGGGDGLAPDGAEGPGDGECCERDIPPPCGGPAPFAGDHGVDDEDARPDGEDEAGGEEPEALSAGAEFEADGGWAGAWGVAVEAADEVGFEGGAEGVDLEVGERDGAGGCGEAGEPAALTGGAEAFEDGVDAEGCVKVGERVRRYGRGGADLAGRFGRCLGCCHGAFTSGGRLFGSSHDVSHFLVVGFVRRWIMLERSRPRKGTGRQDAPVQ
jgi:hypothetical protein